MKRKKKLKEREGDKLMKVPVRHNFRVLITHVQLQYAFNGTVRQV